MTTTYVPALSAARKAALWFAFTFLGLLVPAVLDAITNYTGTLDLSALQALLLPLVGAALITTLRMGLAYLPVLAQDANIGKAKAPPLVLSGTPAAATVTASGGEITHAQGVQHRPPTGP